jgi:hypothetical protein
MQKPWNIVLLSIIPGLGLILLGEIWKGTAALISVPLLFIGSYLTSESGDISIYLFVAGIILWGVQLQYAFMYASRRERVEKGQVPVARQVDIGPLPPDASAVDKSVHHMRQVVTELLEPGENLKTVLQVTTKSPSILPALMAAFVGGTTSGTLEWVYLGLTEKDLVIVEMDALNKPSSLKRIPVGQVKLERYTEGPITDEIVLVSGSDGKLRGRVGRPLHQETRKLITALSGRGALYTQPEAAFAPSPVLAVAGAGTASPASAVAQPAPHPVLNSALVGALGGAAGALVNSLLIAIVGMIFGEQIFGTYDFGEGLGYLVGIYCAVMFPFGGGLLGAIAGLLYGWFQAARDEGVTRKAAFAAGMLVNIVLTWGIPFVITALT